MAGNSGGTIYSINNTAVGQFLDTNAPYAAAQNVFAAYLGVPAGELSDNMESAIA